MKIYEEVVVPEQVIPEQVKRVAKTACNICGQLQSSWDDTFESIDLGSAVNPALLHVYSIPDLEDDSCGVHIRWKDLTLESDICPHCMVNKVVPLINTIAKFPLEYKP